jgi:predicted O-linked N-acetylglucosamine transferase (SPINDLY family)
MTSPSKSEQEALLQKLRHSLEPMQLASALPLAVELAEQGALPIIELFTVCGALQDVGELQRATLMYQLWLSRTASPVAYAVLFNYGVCLAELKDDAAAEDAYRKSLALKPDFIEAHMNLGTLLERKGEVPEALALWNNVTAIANPAVPADRPFHIQALNNLGRVMELRKQFSEAANLLSRSLELDPAQPKVITHLVHLRQKMCQWPVFAPLPGLSSAALRESTSALAMLSASDDPAEQLATAQRFVDEKVMKLTDTPLAPAEGYRHSRLRVGYLSSDLCSHAVSILTAELYELHDRSRVEVYAFSWSREDGTPLRARVKQAMDHYIPITQLNDEQAARLIREHEIDILVDLHGLTLGTRPDILSWRPAPVQLTYLGFPGPTALPGIDYVIADKFVLPPELSQHFTEKPLYMPNCFQINDRQREVGPRPTRAECGLPEDKFVFCSFNSNFKITEEMFASWMRILARAPDSVLWLVSDHESVRSNLRNAAQAAGIDPQRLLFAERVSPANYLARFQCADLFLDTMPFNAGTTASDALWGGLPILTCAGHTFSARMAGSLLLAVNMPQLITHDLASYEEKAVELAHQPATIAALKQQLADERQTCALFDTPQFVRDLESAYERIAVQEDQEIKQTPINEVHNIDVFNFMRPGYRKVVEVGSSSGALARVYREGNPDAAYVGIEIDAGYAEASKRYCTEVILGNVEKLPQETFTALADGDCWIFADALEHLYDPWQMVRKIRANARDGVEIIACIPNAQYWGLQSCLNTGRFIYQDSGLLDRTHIRWMTRITMIDLFQANGFRIEQMISRILNPPGPEMQAAIRAMAAAAGADPELALQDAIPFQYVIRAVAA